MKIIILSSIIISSLLLTACGYFERAAESRRAPLKIYIQGDEFGFGAIIYVEEGFQKTNHLYLDSNNVGITSYPYSSLIEEGGKEPKYQFFRIIDRDTVPQVWGGHNNDSTNISSAIPTSLGGGNLKNTYRFIQFYAGKYPERPKGVHIDSTEIGQWKNLLNNYLEELDRNNIQPQKR